MYVVTFYSFKGGVGRTMAMVNVGLELARTGRRVLMVDFDLEAPGLDTFNLPKPTTPSSGIVDYVQHYLKTKTVDNVENYIYRCPGEGAEGGGLWIMPAGLEQYSYAADLNAIDWGALYRDHDGYLLFENLKEQWRTYLEPDYVLIDSRTGHTDVAGICTRQLPDAVVALFFPTSQNLMGLQKVVSDIRAESSRPDGKAISTHFVAANVPDLDDENKKLADRIGHFRQSLGYESLAATIYHYPSLDLLNQEVFVSKHPNSRLTKEYRELMSAIVQANPEDKEGVLRYLEEILEDPAQAAIRLYGQRLDQKLDKIVAKHSSDPDVLRAVADVEAMQGRFDDAIAQLGSALDLDAAHAPTLLKRAELSLLAGDSNTCNKDVQKIIGLEGTDYFVVNRALRLLKRASDEAPEQIVQYASAAAIRALPCDEKLELAKEKHGDVYYRYFAKALLEDVLGSADCAQDVRYSSGLTLALLEISLHNFEYAKELLLLEGEEALHKNVSSLFNYAICEWALSGSVPIDLFEKVVVINESEGERRRDANYLQCMAISYWATSQLDEAREYLGRARQQSMMRGKSIFSCWTFTSVNYDEFSGHLDQIEEMMAGSAIWPLEIESAPLAEERS